MKRRLVNFACWLSLALCVASSMMWVWSCISRKTLSWSSLSERRGWWMEVSVRNGRLGIAQVYAPPYSSPPGPEVLDIAINAGFWLGFGHEQHQAFGFSGYWFSATDWSYRWLIVPFWFITLITAVLPVWRGRELWRARRSRNRVAAGLCGACGYDLRGGASGRCPECGSATAAA